MDRTLRRALASGVVYEVDVKAELPVDELRACKAVVRRGASRERGCMDLLPEPASPCRSRSVVRGALLVYELWWTRCTMTMSAQGHGRRRSGQRGTQTAARGRGERVAVDSLRTGRGGGRRVRNDDEADPDAQMRAERTRSPCPCPCTRGAAQCRARR
ncbi:hypothetical protein B0H14DRAFT_3015468, partial [Mycena olivaceomarginata]